MKKLLLVLFLFVIVGIVLFVLASNRRDAGGGGSGGYTSALSCVSVKVDVCGEYHVKGMVTNRCEKTIRYALVQSTGYSKSGAVMDRDPEYVDEIPPYGTKSFDAVLDLEVGNVPATCTAVIEDASY